MYPYQIEYVNSDKVLFDSDVMTSFEQEIPDF